MKNVVLFLLVCGITLPAYATLVVPPKDLHKMGTLADIVVYGQMTDYVSDNPFFNQFQIHKVIKGELAIGETIVVREYGSNHGDLVSTILGDVNFKMNTPYLLFLMEMEGGFYMSSVVAMSVFEEVEFQAKRIFAHPGEFLDICFTEEVNNNMKGVYDAQLLMLHLSSSLAGQAIWNEQKAGYLGDIFQINDSNEEQIDAFNSAPCPNTLSSGMGYDHCTTVIGEASQLNGSCTTNSPGKFLDNNWTVTVITNGTEIDTDPVSGISSEFSDLGEAMGLLNSLSGININGAVNQRACSFLCPIVDGSTFPPIVTNPGTFATCSTDNNEILVLLNNPCFSINIPSSVLGFGGAFAPNTGSENDCHTDRCCNKWKNNTIPYVVLNNSVGTEGSYRFTAAIAHEMLHACGLGHVDGSCTALLNPMLCSSHNATNTPDFGLTNMDEACTEWMYVASGVTASNPCVPIVPVELTNFKGEAKSGKNHLSWTTSSEIDNSHFVVERSKDGRKFEAIGKIQGAGTTIEVQRYSFIDLTNTANTAYYRLQQVDFSGTSDYSETIVIQSESKQLMTTVFPSPTNSYLNVASNHRIDRVEILDLRGRSLQAQIYNGLNEIQLDVAFLAKSTYILRIQSEGQTQLKRFVKN